MKHFSFKTSTYTQLKKKNSLKFLKYIRLTSEKMPFETDLNVRLKPSKVYTPADWFTQGKKFFLHHFFFWQNNIWKKKVYKPTKLPLNFLIFRQATPSVQMLQIRAMSQRTQERLPVTCTMKLRVKHFGNQKTFFLLLAFKYNNLCCTITSPQLPSYFLGMKRIIKQGFMKGN